MKTILALGVSILIFTGCTSTKSIQQISAESGYPETRLSKIDVLVRDSDDYAKYREFFLIKTSQLLDQGKIEESGLKEWGGWLRSQNYRGKYFTYKNEDSVLASDKVYIDPRNPNYTTRGKTRQDEEREKKAEKQAFQDFIKNQKLYGQ